MTPTEALAQALGNVVDIDPGTPVEGAYATAGSVHVNWNDSLGAASLLALALDALGYTVARKDDAADGEALRELREALPEGRVASTKVEGDKSAYAATWVWDRGYPMGGSTYVGPTIAEAARAAREALR